MAKSPKAAAKAKTAPKAKAEAYSTEAATKMADESMEKLTGFASTLGAFAEGGMKTLAERASASTEVMRTLGSRNMDFFTRTLEQGVEASQALTSVKDPRQAMEIQTGFAKSLFSAYTSEMNAQAELCMLAWRDAAKPLSAWTTK
ncbi:phasin family protein [Hyphomonas johnsonii]|jgi:phasin|uniref:Phasin n=1 Tax=Hyphomonas johnsonii MHS-2 TaxID=1280950 RepID=A0A059FAM6_9PROT|nr:phasin family protein [Hyphomonas johnsonii]KCZ87601.1 phasin [Hyphomonas johnsonii MHS-2]